MKRIYLAVVAILGLFALAACGSSGSSGTTGQSAPNTTPAQSTSASVGGNPPPSAATSPAATGLPSDPGSVTIGSAAFPENVLLADIYGDAMSAKGVKVSKKLNIGERGVYMTALKDGSIGAIPEYTGSILDYLDTSATAKTPTDVFAALQTAATAKGFVALQYAAAQDSDTITVTKATADQYHLSTIADLKSVAGNLTFGAPAQFRTRADGIPALKSVYGVTFGTFTTLSASGTATPTALKNGTIDAGDIFSTDPSIIANHFVSLKDTKSMFAAQNVVPLFAQKVLTQPMKDACDAVSAKLDTAALGKMVSQVAGGADPDATAKTWLKKNNLG
ncbi:MAG TPA: ABC transporter substrate-binding protein [Jatrophihabitantaceae bacterium]|jgi:osmoprotectant transport system substrate-binding protein|nr:ABC transporter substrate-binding protein [Jatrophihabitantaceae bacterium]